MFNVLDEIIDLIDKMYEADFDFEQEHWGWGNVDDSWQYGRECGEQYLIRELKKILEEK